MNIPFHKPFISKNVIKKIDKVLKNGWLTMGSKTIEFENKFKDYIGAKHAIAVNSATAALHLSAIAANIKNNDEVIVPAMTFVATAEILNYCHAKPIFVDINKDTHLIDVNQIEKQITSRTKAIFPVHYAGQLCDMDEIMQLAKKYNLKIIEDAAHALPATYKGKSVGTIGDATCFSFYATKTLTTGEGGMITTNNDTWADRMRQLRLHGINRDAWERNDKRNSWEYDVSETGYKYNLNDIASVLGIEQLKEINLMNNKRNDIAEYYTKAFNNIDGIILYKVKNDRQSANYLYTIKLNLDVLNIDRDNFILKLNERGIKVSVHFKPLYRFTYYKNLGYNVSDYPVCEWVYNRIISLPIYPGMKKKQIDYIVENVIELVKKYKR